MKQNIMIVLLSVIAALLGYLAVEWKDSREAQAVVADREQRQPEIQKEPSNNIILVDGGYINMPQPDYPKLSVENEEEGITEIEFIVDESGKVEYSKVAISSGSRTLDRAGLMVVNNAKFKPDTNTNPRRKKKFKTKFEFKLN